MKYPVTAKAGSIIASLVTSHQLAKALGVTPVAVNYWTKIGMPVVVLRAGKRPVHGYVMKDCVQWLVDNRLPTVRDKNVTALLAKATTTQRRPANAKGKNAGASKARIHAR